ncbi:putative disease resistance protein RGA4 [Dichanthelium oligosanthes]|uniref:Putative disease resistance protein RGA4 n=1 Tax=Dichanthelium oligosanthes TaxID=888268 RepID=A0A1E5WIR3_9POAL|nr:putative disease resistance protein RGA4 [Dichanthelium oligosanthes]
MAVVLDALASYVKKMITDMPKEEVRMLLGVSREINKLKHNLVYLQDYATDAERRRITDVSVQSWVKKLKDAMYKAADILELCQLEAMERQEKSSRGGDNCSCFSSLEGLLGETILQDVIQPFLFCLQNPFFAHETGSRIKKLNQELEDIREGVTKFKFIKLSSYEEQRRPTDTAHARRKTTAGFDESAVVGDKIQKDTEKLVQMLISNRSHGHDSGAAVKVVSIVGPGGMGKSTLARKVLASGAIKEEFKTKIWLSVTQQFDKVELLKSAITQAKKEPAKGKDESFLEQTLTEALSANKFLLVLDDVWTERAWKDVLQIPVANAGRRQPGSRVLVTTRNEDAVLKMGPCHSPSDQLHVSRLDDEDAWSLLKKQLPQRQVGANGDFDELKHIGMKIIKKCDGLPLAIKVMGGLLSTRRPKERDWEIVLDKNIEWKKDEPKEEEELNYSIRLSYEDLSPQLKQCFLYYSLFPKGSTFIEERVISMWISEGFVQHDGKSESDQVDPEEIGKEYHRELVARNLLEPDDSTDNIWDYTMHDIVRSFAQSMAREEAFVVHKDQADIRSLLPENQKFRRLSIETDSELEWTILENQETLRTLLIRCDIKPGGSLANFTSLRVLDISSDKSDWLVDTLCQLRHLRYLSFSNTNISRLPGDIHKLWFLQHIQLDNCTKLDKLPDSIIKLVCLRYLSLTGSKVDIIPRGFGGLTNLRSLYGFPVNVVEDWCTLEELEALTHLRNLQIQNLENVHDSSIAKKAKISNKKYLEYLELNCYDDDDGGGGDDDDDDEEEEDENEDEEEEEEEEEATAGEREREENKEIKHIEEDDDEKEEEGEDNNKEGKHTDEEEDGDDNKDDKDEKIEEENEEGEQNEEGVEKEAPQIEPEQQLRIEAVFDELCPPPKLDTLIISRYFGGRLPNWMQSTTETIFESLRSISLQNITYCTQLPDGLCRIPGLEELMINNAPAIKHVGRDFQTIERGNGGIVTTPFKDLTRLELLGLSGWKEWDWEEEQSEIISMPALEYLTLTDCKLTRLPPGLASDQRYNLREIFLETLTLLEYLENFPSVVKLSVDCCRKLKKISGFSKLQTVYIYDCPKLKVLEGVMELDSMVLDDDAWEITETPVRCTPKGYQAGPLRQLSQDITIIR